MKHIPASKPERPRVREYGEEDESNTEGALPVESGRVFALLFADAQGEGGYVSRSPSSIASANKLMIEAMAEQLAFRVQASTQWPLLAVLYLPGLGRINTSVQRLQGALSIELQAQEAPTALWLGTVKRRFESRLAEALGQPVDVLLPHVAPA